MTATALTYQEKVNILRSIGRLYRRSCRRIDLSEMIGENSPGNAAQKEDYDLKALIERTLLDCSKTTRLIADNEFLHICERNWYRVYFSQSVYYRLRRKAVDEFLECLEITG